MRLTGSKLIADLHQADSALFLCDDVFTLLRSFVRIEILKLLCGDKENILWKDFLDKIILDGHVGLSLAQCLVYGTNDLLECIEIAFTLDDDLLPVPLVYIDRVNIVGDFIAADSVHIGVKPFTVCKAIFLERVALPLCKRLNNLSLPFILLLDAEADRTLNAI